MANDIFGLTGKVAVLTGSAQGIGKATAARFAEMGAKVIISDIQEEKGRAAADEIGPGTVFHRCDVADEGDARRLIDRVNDEHGRLDILVNNADAPRFRTRVTIDELPSEAWRHKVDIAVHGTFYCSTAASGHMIRQGSGCIINIASVAGVVALRLQAAHVATKAAIIRMSQAMALELGPKGIRVNSISPGSTVTDNTRQIFYSDDAASKDRAGELLSFIPMGRPAEPEDIANAALYLASDLASYVHGHNLIVDGGWTAGHNRDL